MCCDLMTMIWSACCARAACWSVIASARVKVIRSIGGWMTCGAGRVRSREAVRVQLTGYEFVGVDVVTSEAILAASFAPDDRFFARRAF